MRNFEIGDELDKILYKLSKKDPKLHKQIMNKIKEIITSKDVEHYKNLKASLNKFKRIHIRPFVLIFQYNKENDSLLFDDFDHHDKIYIKK